MLSKHDRDMLHFINVEKKGTMKQLLTVLLCSAALHAFSEDASSPETLNDFMKKDPAPWPQQRVASWDTFGINAIQTMWLVDKKGVVRDVNAREGMEQKVEGLLAEP